MSTRFISNFWYLLLITSLQSCEDYPINLEKELRVNFSIDKLVVKRGETIQFSNESRNAVSYHWEFGDGITSDEINPVHSYSKSGTFEVKLTATNEYGKSLYKTDKIFIKDLTVMSYNIALGGGAIPLVIEIDQSHVGYDSVYHKNRIKELLTVIREVDPDILCLQESLLWDYFDPPYYQSFADSLNMKYYHYLEQIEVEWNGLCIYSKYPIKAISYALHQPCFPSYQIWNGACMVKTQILLSSEMIIDLYNCHLSFHAEGVQDCEVESITDSVDNDFNSYTILLGDMNYVTRGDVYYNDLFYNTGLRYLSSDIVSKWPLNIDQVWASQKLFDKSVVFDYNNLDEILNPATYELLDIASDHHPVVAYFGFD